MANQRNPENDVSTKPYWGFTFVYLLAIVGVSLCFKSSFLNLHADGWGNYLAGVFSPLAFLWLVYTAVAQRAELQLQREELKQNNESQRQQAEALQAQAKQFQAQADAAYSPIIVLQGSEIFDHHVELNLFNHGASVFDLKGYDHFRLVNYEVTPGGLDVTPRGMCLSVPIWPKDCRLRVYIATNRPNEDSMFLLNVRRADLLRVKYTCLYMRQEERVRVLRRDVEDPENPLAFDAVVVPDNHRRE